MADSQNDGSSPVRPVLRLLKLFSYGILVVVAGQLLVNPPERRPHVVCWPVYASANFFGVTLFRIVVYGEPAVAINNSLRLERFYASCVATTARLPGFHAGSTLGLPAFPRLTGNNSQEQSDE